MDRHLDIDRLRLDNAEAFSWMDCLEEGSADMVCTDPPYGIDRVSGTLRIEKDGTASCSSKKLLWESRDLDLPSMFSKFYRTLRKGGVFVCFFDQWRMQELRAAAEEAGFRGFRLLYWVKTNPIPLNCRRGYLSSTHETMLYGVKGKCPTWNMGEDRKFETGFYCYASPHVGRLHGAQKPLGLVEELVRQHTNPGDLVVDPFSGSATCAAACISSGRRFAGCELDEENYKVACERLKRCADVPGLF